MNGRLAFALLSALMVLAPLRAPAPLIYTPGEGWMYEPVGSEGKWRRQTAKEQLIVAQDAFDKKNHSLALKAARHVVRAWPMSDYAPQAQYLVGRCQEARRHDEKAFKAYQDLLANYPKSVQYDEVLKRQYEIASRFLVGQRFRLWQIIPFRRSMEKTARLYEAIVTNGPYSDIAAQAQLRIGEAREKQSNYPEAAKAYERAADRYHDRPAIASAALFKEGIAYREQAQKADYDQSTASQAISTLTDFMTLYPDDPNFAEARKMIGSLRLEQARGNFEIARYYEKNHRWNGALVYYNEVLLRDPESPYAGRARERIEELKKRLQAAAP